MHSLLAHSNTDPQMKLYNMILNYCLLAFLENKNK